MTNSKPGLSSDPEKQILCNQLLRDPASTEQQDLSSTEAQQDIPKGTFVQGKVWDNKASALCREGQEIPSLLLYNHVLII